MGTRAIPDRHFREIAVTVQSRSDGYRWQLLEKEDSGGDWQVLSAARASAKRYRDAMADGLLALQAITADLDAGPQSESNAEDVDQLDHDEPPLPRKGGAFGFGQLR